MARRQYRITEPTLAVFDEKDGRVIRPLPEGAIIAFDTDALKNRRIRLIKVVWEDHHALMFARDLKNLAWRDAFLRA